MDQEALKTFITAQFTAIRDDQAKMSARLDTIFNVVVGDGGPSSMSGRLILMESRQVQADQDREALKARITKLEECVDRMDKKVTQWESKAAGIGLALTTGGALLAFFGSRILTWLATLMGP